MHRWLVMESGRAPRSYKYLNDAERDFAETAERDANSVFLYDDREGVDVKKFVGKFDRVRDKLYQSAPYVYNAVYGSDKKKVRIMVNCECVGEFDIPEYVDDWDDSAYDVRKLTAAEKNQNWVREMTVDDVLDMLFELEHAGEDWRVM